MKIEFIKETLYLPTQTLYLKYLGNHPNYYACFCDQKHTIMAGFSISTYSNSFKKLEVGDCFLLGFTDNTHFRFYDFYSMYVSNIPRNLYVIDILHNKNLSLKQKTIFQDYCKT